MKFSILYTFILTTIICCNGDRKEQKAAPYPLIYEAVVFKNKTDFTITEIIVKADSTGRVCLQLELRSKTDNQIEFLPSDWELETIDGLRSTPIGNADSLIFLEKETTSSLTLTFEPTNSLKLYRLIGLKGDLGQHYKLMFKQNLLGIDLNLSDEQYKQYKESWSQERNLHVFQTDMPSDFVNEELNHLRASIQLNHDHERIEHGTHVSESEILVDGLNIKLASYFYRDTITVDVALVNHSPFVTSIEPSSIKLRIEKEMIEPFMPKRILNVTIPKSQRSFIRLKYPMPMQEVLSYEIDISSLSFQIPAVTPIFYTKTIQFRKSKV